MSCHYHIRVTSEWASSVELSAFGVGQPIMQIYKPGVNFFPPLSTLVIGNSPGSCPYDSGKRKQDSKSKVHRHLGHRLILLSVHAGPAQAMLNASFMVWWASQHQVYNRQLMFTWLGLH